MEAGRREVSPIGINSDGNRGGGDIKSRNGGLDNPTLLSLVAADVVGESTERDEALWKGLVYGEMTIFLRFGLGQNVGIVGQDFVADCVAGLTVSD